MPSTEGEGTSNDSCARRGLPSDWSLHDISHLCGSSIREVAVLLEIQAGLKNEKFLSK
jgi:hypothetical protein